MIAIAKKPAFTPSAYQLDILAHYEDSKPDNLMVEAVAGGSKTTMLKLIAKQLMQQNRGSIIYLAFNKEIVNDVLPSFEPLGVTVKTFHGWAMSGLMRAFGKLDVDTEGKKYKNLWYQALDSQSAEFLAGLKRYITSYKACQVINFLRLSVWGVDNWSANTLIDVLGHPTIALDCPIEWVDSYASDLVDLFKGILEAGIEMRNFIDFTDMLYLPVYYGLPMPRFDYYLCDEAQDFSILMQRLLQQSEPDTHKTFVLDRNQCIFAFAGADINSVNRIAHNFDTASLPLSVCYRCPDQVLDLARKYVPHIEGTGKQGQLNRIDLAKAATQLQKGDLYISRTNAPLAKLYFELVAAGQVASIKGRDYGEMLQGWIKLMEKSLGLDLQEQIQDVYDQKCSLIREPEDTRWGLYGDVYECLNTIVSAGRAESISDLSNYVSTMFSKEACLSGVTLSSVHRSKGLENPTVYFYEGERGLAAPGQGQEANIAYVGITRAQEVLNIVSP